MNEVTENDVPSPLVLVDADVGAEARARLRDLVARLRDRGFGPTLIETEDADPPGVRGALALRKRVAALKPSRPWSLLHVAGPRARLAARMSRNLCRLPRFDEPFHESPTRGFFQLLENLLRFRGPSPRTFVPAPPGASVRAASDDIRVGPGLDFGSSPLAATSDSEQGQEFRVGLVLRDGATGVLREFLEAFRAFKAGYPAARLVIPYQREPWQIHRWLADLALESTTTQVADDELEPARLSLAWVPARDAYSSRRLASFLAHGVPVVCDYRTLWARGIQEIGGALMRDADWPVQFAEASRDLFENQELYEALGRAGVILAQREAGRDEYAGRVSESYRMAMPRR